MDIKAYFAQERHTKRELTYRRVNGQGHCQENSGMSFDAAPTRSSSAARCCRRQ